MRDVVGYIDTRRKILEGRPTSRASWVAFAAANYSADEFQVAFEIINKYHENVSDKGDSYEEGELLLFQNLCLEKDGKFEDAINHLNKHKAQIVDKLSFRTKIAQLLTLSGNQEEALVKWEEMIVEQPENYRFHRGLQATLLQLDVAGCYEAFNLKKLELPSTAFKLDEEKRALLLNWYKGKTIKSRAIEKIKLFLSYGTADFEATIEKYMKKCLLDAVPSLCHDICSLVMTPDLANNERTVCARDAFDFRTHPVVEVVNRLLDNYISHLISIESKKNDESVDDAEWAKAPIALLWAKYLRAHMLEMSGDIIGALQIIDQCILHTPTALDMHCKKARLFKKLGQYDNAAITMDECRALDLQDRYLNNKATKYFLRSDEVDQAMDTIAMFTKHDGDPQKNLFDLQCSWYELEAAESYARQKRWGAALKKFFAVKTHFTDQYDDLFDFHGYCIRKTTLRVYLDVLSVQDSSFSHKNYQRALRGVLKIYLHLIDCPEDIDGLGHLAPAERKKERAKLKKKKQQKDGKDEDAAATAGEETKTEEGKEDGEDYLQKDFLTEAATWLSLLNNRLEACDCETLALISEIMMRRNKYLQAVRAINAGFDKDRLNPDLTVTFVKLVLKLKGKKYGPMNAVTLAVIKQEVKAILGSENYAAVSDFILEYIQNAKRLHSLTHVIAAVKCLTLVDKAGSLSTIAELLNVPNLLTGRNAAFKNVLDVAKVSLSSIQIIVLSYLI